MSKRPTNQPDRPVPDLKDAMVEALAPNPDALSARLNALAQRMADWREADQTALELQAREYERRLDGLNGEAMRLQAMKSEFVPRELYDSVLLDWSKWRSAADLHMADTIRNHATLIEQIKARELETKDRASSLLAEQTRKFDKSMRLWAFGVGLATLLVMVVFKFVPPGFGISATPPAPDPRGQQSAAYTGGPPVAAAPGPLGSVTIPFKEANLQTAPVKPADKDKDRDKDKPE